MRVLQWFCVCFIGLMLFILGACANDLKESYNRGLIEMSAKASAKKPSTAFHHNQKVLIIDGFYRGERGRVEHYEKSSDMYYVNTSGGWSTRPCKASELEAKSIREGDRVKVSSVHLERTGFKEYTDSIFVVDGGFTKDHFKVKPESKLPGYSPVLVVHENDLTFLW